jgi:methyl-accepting chemotaxis protein
VVPAVTAVLAFVFVLGVLTLLAWALRWFAGARERALRRLLDRADALEKLLKDTRDRMASMRQVVQRVPSDIGAVAHASLDTNELVQQALRNLLEHRMWIAQKGLTAPKAELDAASAALERAHANIADQLQRLENAGAELADVTQASVEQAAREPAALKRAGNGGS